MRHLRCLSPSKSFVARAFTLLLLGFLGFAAPARAAIEDITKAIWKMSYGVTDAQITSSAWLDADDDKDGVTNGAEIAAGTNPSDATKTIRITSTVKNGNSVELTFRTARGKKYLIQSTTTVGNAGSWVAAGAEIVGTTSPTQMLSVPFAPDTFYRVLVQDTDTDNDGASDWAEVIAGYNPNDATTNGGSTMDGVAMTGAIATSDLVTVSVTKGNATQPLAGFAPVETGSITVSRGGPLKFHSITVPLQKSGSAIEGTDYSAITTPITFGAGVGEVVVSITPLANSNRKTNVTATVQALAGGGYSLGAATSGSVVINPAGVANGTGLTAKYQNTSSSTYSIQQGIFAGTTAPLGAEMTRTDATVDFLNNTGGNGWGTTAGPTGMSPASTNAAFSVRWTGQILPQFSETYSIDFRSDDSAKVWVNGQLLIDRWVGQGATDYVNTIPLQAGVFYDIVIEYWNSTGTAEARLYWWSASQVKQIIPQARLFPEPTQASKPTAITSSLAAIGYEGTPFSFSVTSANIGAAGTTTYALAPNSGPLPPGLTLSSSTGVIAGTPTVAGTYNVAIDATNVAAGSVTGSSIVNITIFPVGGITRETLAANGTVTADGVIQGAFDDDDNYANNTSRRLRGYLVPPKTGNYYFWIAANNAAELWISDDSEYVNKVRRAYLVGGSGKKNWGDANPLTSKQQTQWLSLVAGEKYYFEVLHNTGTDADDHVALGWCQDDIGTVPSVVGAVNPTGAATSLPVGGGPLQGYPFSGTAPGYLFQPYDYPVVTPPSGTLYACNLGPQTSAITSASGSANIQVNAAETQAILHFKYQNLASPKTAYHLHVDGFIGADGVNHPAGEIIYDIDDADGIPELRTPDGGYIWDLTTTVGTFSSVVQIREAIHKGKVYLNIHSVGYPNGEIRGTFGLIDGSQTPPDASQYAEPTSDLDVASNAAHAARFLNQATFGASPADVSYVQTNPNGFPGWITNQLSKPASRTSNDVVAGLTADVNTPYPSSLFTNTWWKNSIGGPDQLRQRLAFALSEIMVVSWANNTGPLQNNGRVLADYYDQLVDYCLPTAGLTDSGNFRGILKVVTLTPAMGLYLDMRANQKGDDTIGRHPNENYAREIMQLFSVGIYRMWDDGRFVLGSDAGLVSTYTQPSIIGLANLFTGWNYAQPNQSNGRLPTNFGPGADYLNPMVLVPIQHELGSKLLLNNVNSPAATGRTPRVEVASIVPAVPNTNPCTVNTFTIHGLKTGDTVRIAGVATGTFTGGLTAINASHQATVTSATAFTVPVACSVAPTVASGKVPGATVTGATITPAAIAGTAGISAVTGSQADNAGSTVPHPYDQYGLKELDLAIDNIVNNDNVPPYICRQLIQRLVTSDPSPGYIYRVVQKFKNNGSGVRGDLAAVVSQILLDGEARSTARAFANDAFGNSFGKQREPVMRLTGPARAFAATNYTGTYSQLTGVNSNRLRIVTSTPNDFNSGFTVSLDFRGNYTATSPPNPYTNPTSTAYAINSTLGIANTTTDISSIAVSTPCRVVTVQPHGLSTGHAVIITGVTGGTFLTSPGGASTALTTQRTITMIDANTFDVVGVECTVAPTSVASAKMISNPCKITTVQAHGLTTGDSVTISSSGGAFSPVINGATFPVTVVDATSFTVLSNCTAAATANSGSLVGANTLDVTATGMTNATYTQTAGSNILTVNTGGPPTNVAVPGAAMTVSITGIAVGNPCTVTTSAAHNLVTGGVVTIAGAGGDGIFTTAINGTFVPTIVDATSFTVPVECTQAPTAAAGTANKRIRSRVYLKFLTQTTAGGAVIPVDNIFDVVANPTGATFTVTTTDTPATGRGGNLLLPKLTTSYSPTTDLTDANSATRSNAIVIFNTNVNHNLTNGNTFWVDVPVVGSPLTDAEYVVPAQELVPPLNTVINRGVVDEDHLRVFYQPANTNGGTYPKPSGANNGITIYPLVPPPLGRSGVVTINQSTFNLGSTEASLTQSPLNAPTVFNYFFPDYKFPGTLANSGLDSPEFQLTTDTNVMNLTNSVTNMIIGTGGANGNLNGLTSFNNGGGAVVMDIGSYIEPGDDLSNAAIPALVDQLATLLVGAPLSTAPIAGQTPTRTAIINFVANNTNFPYTTATNLQKRDRVRAIIHLILTSAEYAVQK